MKPSRLISPESTHASPLTPRASTLVGPLPGGEGYGFTLLEILIALAITTIVAASLYSCLYIAFKARDAGVRTVANTGQMFSALELLGRDFESALPPTGTIVAEFQGSSTGGSTSGSGTSGTSGLSGMGGGLKSSNSSLNNSTGGLHAIPSDPTAVQFLSFYSAGNQPRDNELGCDIRKIELSVETPPDNSTSSSSNSSKTGTGKCLMRRIYYNLLPAKAPTPREQILCRNVHSALYLRYFDGTLWRDDWDSTRA